MDSVAVTATDDRPVARSSGSPQPAIDLTTIPRRRLNVAFLVRSLGYGGAERQLVVLAKALRESGHAVSVLTFYTGGPMETELRSAGLRVRSLEKRGRWDMVGPLLRLRRFLREERPDVLHGYLGTPNIATTSIGALFPKMKTVWGERASNMDLAQYGWFSQLSSVICRALSRFPDLVIVNSRAGLAHVVKSGYRNTHMIVIPNGIDTDRFAPNPQAGRELRRAWNVPEDVTLIGRIGRLDRMKDHPTLLDAASKVVRRRGDVRFVCVGEGDARYRGELTVMAQRLSLGDRVLWIPAQADMSAVYNALDIACSSSAFGEGFPNVVGEAMACGTPCVVTDVGDSAFLVADPRLTVPPSDAGKLADALEFVLSLGPVERGKIGADARARVLAHFSVQHLTEATERALLGLFEDGR